MFILVSPLRGPLLTLFFSYLSLFFCTDRAHFKTTIADLIQISPEDFRKPSAQAIEDNINAKYANKVTISPHLHVLFFGKMKRGNLGIFSCPTRETSGEFLLCLCMCVVLGHSEDRTLHLHVGPAQGVRGSYWSWHRSGECQRWVVRGFEDGSFCEELRMRGVPVCLMFRHSLIQSNFAWWCFVPLKGKSYWGRSAALPSMASRVGRIIISPWSRERKTRANCYPFFFPFSNDIKKSV